MPFDFGTNTSSFQQGPSLGINPGGGGILEAVQAYRGLTAQDEARARQKKMQDFMEKTGPELIAQLNDAPDAQSVLKIRGQLHSSALQAGFDPAHIESLDKALVGPSLANLGADQIGEIGRQLSPSTTVTEEPANLKPLTGSLGPGLEQFNMGVPTLKTTPGRNVNQADMLKLAEIEARTGVKPPSGLAGLIAAPSLVDEHAAQAAANNALASRRKTQRQIEQRQIDTLEGLPEDEIGTSGISARTLGLATKGGGLTQYATQSMPQREKPESETDVALKKSQIDRNKAQAQRYGALTKQAGGTARMTALFNEYTTLGGSPDDEEGFLSYVERRTKAARKPDILDPFPQNRGGANRSTAPGGKPGQRQGAPSASSVLQKYGIGQ
jgi:hypothetical protein